MNKVLTFIIGVLVGAILTTAGFLVYINMTVDKNAPSVDRTRMMEFRNGRNGGQTQPGGEMPELPNGEIPQNSGKFKGDKSQKNNQSTSNNLTQNTI